MGVSGQETKKYFFFEKMGKWMEIIIIYQVKHGSSRARGKIGGRGLKYLKFLAEMRENCVFREVEE